MPLVSIPTRRINPRFQPSFKVALNRSNPLAAKMRAFYLGGREGMLNDLAGYVGPLGKTGTRGLPTVGASEGGAVSVFTTASTQVLTTAVIGQSRLFAAGSFAYPFAFGARYRQKSAATMTIFGLDVSTSTNAVAGARLRNTGLGIYRYNLTSPDVDSSQIYYDGGAGLANSAHTVICVSLASNDHRLYIDGKQVGTSTTNVSATMSKPMDMVEMGGNRNYTGVNDFDEFAEADIEFAFFSDAAWSASEVRAFSENPYQVVRPLMRPVWLAVSAGGATLAGDAAGVANSTGALTTQIPLAGAALVVATATATFTTSIPISGAAQGVASGSGAFTTQIQFSGAAVAAAAAAAGLGTGIALGGAAQGVASGNASLTIQIRLQGAAVGNAAASAGLTADGGGFSGAAQGSASGSASLTTGIPLLGAAISVANSAGDLSTAVPLAGASASVSSALGSLDTSIQLTGAAVGQALSGGDLNVTTHFDGAALGNATASGLLSGGGYIKPPNNRLAVVWPEARVITVRPETRQQVA